jgi:AbiV family abortive infection protein
MKTKFESIKTLSNKSLIDGIRHCFDNSNNLFDSAIVLKRNKKFGVATSILILSIEALIKSLSLLNMLVSDNDDKEMVKEIFESKDLHKNRLEFALFMNVYLQSVNFEKIGQAIESNENPEDFLSSFFSETNMTKIFNKVEKEKQTLNNWFSHANENKNLGLYVAFNNNKWYTPDKITSEDFKKSLKETKSIRKKLSFLIAGILSIEDEIDLNNVITMIQKNIKLYVLKAGIEPTS